MDPVRRGFVLAAASAALPAWADLPALIATVRASVLPVGTYSATDSPRFGFRGTGFVVGDGKLVATNFHVLAAGADSDSGPRMAVLRGRGPEGAEVRAARVVATDREHDLALLRFEGEALPALRLGETAAREGQTIALMGFPIGGTLGFAPVTHHGIVASLTTVALPAANARQLDARAVARLRGDGNFEVIQLDATAYPGNSGGPVFDVESGAVIGLVNMVLVKGSRESALSSPTGISYAIPVRHLAELLQPVPQAR